MECGICMEAFDSTEHRPKMFPCGHSACLACVEGFKEKRCPECRREFTCTAKDLAHNFTVLRMLESTFRRLPKFWCSDCNDAAKPNCIANHALKSAEAALKDEVVQLQVRAALVAEDLPEALRVDDDGVRVQALRVLQLARQPGTTLEVSVRGQGGEQAFTATWTNPPAAPTSQKGGSTEDVQAVVTNVLVLALAKKGLWQQRGEQGQDGAQGQGEGQGGAAPDLPVLEELEVELQPTPKRKVELLRTAREHRVRILTGLWCKDDPAWSLQLLQLAAPHVEHLQALSVSREHLQAVLAMPRLWRLDVSGNADSCQDESDFPAELPPLPAHHAGLRSLCVYGLPRETTFSLVRAYAATLEELMLYVGTSVGKAWPEGCDDLHAALGRSGLARLRRLTLDRPYPGHEAGAGRCRAQLSALRGALPGVLVRCQCCDNVY